MRQNKPIRIDLQMWSVLCDGGMVRARRAGRASVRRCSTRDFQEDTMGRFGQRLCLSGVIGASLLALGAAGCASEREPISRVQPNAISKHFLIGADLGDPADDPEFRWRNYVVDASVSQSSIGIGSWGHVDRIKWEVTENLLIARKAYAIAAGGNDDKTVGPSPGANGDYVKTNTGT